MVGNSQKWPKIVQNGWDWYETLGNGWRELGMVKFFGNGKKWLEKIIGYTTLGGKGWLRFTSPTFCCSQL